MKQKEKLFELLREACETPQESLAVEEMIRKVEGNMPTVEIVDETHQKFNGIVYGMCKAPRMEGRYFKLLSLHRMVWTCYNGEIPEGYDIHHSDGDKNNNDISNLIALPKSVHQSLHARANGKKTRKNRGKFVCVNCGCEYEADDNGHNLYCSRKCLEDYKKHVLYAETRVCQNCGKEFSAYRYGHQKFCCHECSTEYAKRNNRHEFNHCAMCGKKYRVKPSKRDRSKYCSRECCNAARQKK